jgi:hypothetical protein
MNYSRSSQYVSSWSFFFYFSELPLWFGYDKFNIRRLCNLAMALPWLLLISMHPHMQAQTRLHGFKWRFFTWRPLQNPVLLSLNDRAFKCKFKGMSWMCNLAMALPWLLLISMHSHMQAQTRLHGFKWRFFCMENTSESCAPFIEWKMLSFKFNWMCNLAMALPWLLLISMHSHMQAQTRLHGFKWRFFFAWRPLQNPVLFS